MQMRMYILIWDGGIHRFLQSERIEWRGEFQVVGQLEFLMRFPCTTIGRQACPDQREATRFQALFGVTADAQSCATASAT